MKIRQITRVVAPILLTAILTLVIVGGSQAQQQRMRMTPEQQAAQLKDSLGLDTTQVAKIAVIFKEQQDKMTELRNANQGGDMQAMRDAMTEMRKKTDDKIKTVLTDAQKAKYDIMIKNRPVGGMRPRGN
jgi:uncharacterized protein HemX